MKTLDHLMQAIAEVHRVGAQIMRQRHPRYGYDNITDAGPEGLITRMTDKLARLRQIHKNPELEQGDHDTLRDTYLDLMNYALIGILLLDGTWTGLQKLEDGNDPVPPVDPRIMAVEYDQIRKLMANLQQDMRVWSDHNFGDQPALHPMMGLYEEMGELAHAWLKNEQGIRVNEDHEANMKDAIGDWMVFANDFCSRMGWNLGDILIDTWEQVRKRDWTKNKENGINA